MKRLSILLATLSLAGCGAPPPEQSDPPNEIATERQEMPAESEGASTHGDDTPVPREGNGSEATPRSLAEIPTGFRGRWDSSREACAQAASEMRLVVSADNLRFYESVGQVLVVRPQEEDRVAVDLRTTGEGETRTESRTLSMTSDGRLTVESGGTSATRVRCAG